ncbi:MAG TPA: ABC-2 family transporter protein, partial [Spirochaetales bacterium]|nr:ABC-2 family transporter protein [Spirochaetales bacterium]HRY53476.1 ABC-2 family transporter protein [Spirochaetia bacterium]
MDLSIRGRARAYATFLGASFSANLKSVLEYRANFLLQVFGMMLNNAAFALFWGILIDRTGGIGGYSFEDVMVVWALVSTAFGLAHVVAGNVRSLGDIAVRGELDVYLLQPKDAFVNVLCSRTVVSAWGDFLYGYLVLCLLPGLSAGRLLLFSLLAAEGALVFAAAFAAAECLAFFLGNSRSLSEALHEFLLSFSLYPEKVFDPGMRWAFYTILPSGFIAFVPLAAFKAMDWGLVPILFLVAAAYMAASYALFRAGLRRYESGNQMGTRL